MTKRETRKSISTLELDLMDIPTQPFAYLADVKAYVADTWDLTDDRESRMYWLNTFRESTTKTAQIGMELLNFANFVRFFTRGKKTDRKQSGE